MTLALDFLDTIPKPQATKARIDKMRHQTSKLLCGKGNNQQSIKVTQGITNNIFKPYV